MVIPGVLLLAAYTARSQAYAQALARHGLYPEKVLLLGDPMSERLRDITWPDDAPGPDFFIPDLSEPLLETCERNDWAYERVPESSVNSPAILNQLVAIGPRAVVYSGYGGEIVSKEILDAGAPFLHIHSGWLPEQRGSTTLYYSILSESYCGVSALLLDENIDTGSILARKSYPLPLPGVDIDYLYDSALRADLLVEVLEAFSRTAEFPDPIDASGNETAFYVIHPVLKHLAVLSLSARARD